MKKIIFILLVMLFSFSLGGYSAYQRDNLGDIQQRDDLGYQYRYYSSIFNYHLYEGISSIDELNQFANNYQGGMVNPELNDENYFTSKSLIAFLLPEGSGGNRNEIDSYTLEDGKLTINVKKINVCMDCDMTCDMAYWLVFFELSKEEYAKVSNVVINKDGTVYELENVKTYETKMSEEMPDDFWIFIWVTPFIEYDSRTKILRDGYDISSRPNKTELVLEEEQLKEIYKLLRDGKFDMYPDAAFVTDKDNLGGSISFSINANGVVKSIYLDGTDEINVEDWICCKELGNTFYKIFDEYIKSSEAFKALQLTKKTN
jgi:hypothetical protein